MNYGDKMQVMGISYADDKKYVYTEVYDTVLCKYQDRNNNPTIALVFGKILGYTLRAKKQRYCGSKENLADELFIGLSTVKDAIKILLEDKLILDITPKTYHSKKQVRHYTANLEEFKKLKLVPKEKSLTPKEREKQKIRDDEVRQTQKELYDQWGMSQLFGEDEEDFDG